jgi:predicted RNase H-like HicB family nuclease
MMKKPMQPDARDYEIRIWYSAEKGDECFVAQVVEWPGIMAHGDTREEAARQIQLALEGGSGSCCRTRYQAASARVGACLLIPMSIPTLNNLSRRSCAKADQLSTTNPLTDPGHISLLN